MWWYYKCVNLIKVLIQGSKVILFSIENALQENHGHGWSSAPYGQSDSISRRWAASKPDSWKDEARPRLLPLLFPLATLGRSWTRRAQTRARLTWKPARWTLTTKPTIGGGLRLCQSRNGATNPTVAEESFPGDVTRRRSKPAEFPEQCRSWTRDTRNKELNSRGKTKQLRACFKPIQASTNWIPNPDWTG